MFNPRHLVLCISFAIIVSSSAFAPQSSGRSFASKSALNVFGPKQALAIEKRKNPQAFESTIQGLMKTKGLSRADAEKVRNYCLSYYFTQNVLSHIQHIAEIW